MAGHGTTGALARRAAWSAAAIGVPILVTWAIPAVIVGNPVRSIGALGIWWALLLVAKLSNPAESTIEQVASVHISLSGHRMRYRRLLLAHADRIDTAGLTPAGDVKVRLTDVYVDTNVRHEVTGAGDDPFVGTSHDTAGRRPLLATLRKRKAKPVLILGEPGSGKTTALRRAAIETCRRPVGARSIPVLLELRHHIGQITGSEPPHLPEVAAGADWLHGQVPPEWFESQLSRGRCLVMLDGLDEIPSQSQRRAVTEWLREQMERYSGNAFIVTSRTGAQKTHALGEVDVWRMRPLADVQIASFVYSWCQVRERQIGGHTRGWIRDEAAAEAGVLLSRLRANRELYEMASQPLLLNLIVLIHRHCGFLPDTRAGLYADTSDVLLRWLGGEAGGDSAAQMRATQRHEVLQVLAYHMMDTRSTSISVSDAHLLLAGMLRHARPRRIPEAVLFEAADAGVLIRCDSGDLAFSHMSMQEYLAARQLHESATDSEVAAKINDPWWREVILLWAADTDATRVVEACLRAGNLAGLGLAYDAAEASGMLSDEIRLQLKHMLSSATESLPAVRLMGSVKATREMRDTLRLHGGIRLSTRPISDSLYASFLEAEYPSRESGKGYSASGEAPALGMWASDATRFVDWMNSLPRTEGEAFELPTKDDLLDPLFDVESATQGRPVWVWSDPHPELFHPNGSHNPYTLGDGWWQRAVQADRERSSLLIYLMAQSLGPMFTDLARDVAGDLRLDRDRAHRLPKELHADARLREARSHLGYCDLSPEGEESTDPRSREHLDHVIDTVTRLAAEPDTFRAGNATDPVSGEPFAFVAALSETERRLLATSLTMLWFSRRPHKEKLRYRQSLEWFDAYMSKLVFPANLDRSRAVQPEQLSQSIQRAQRMVKAAPKGDDESVLFAMARDVLSKVATLLGSELVHSMSYTTANVRCARSAVLAVAATVPASRMTPTDARRLISQLGTVAAGLTVLEQRLTGQIQVNETILLLRK